MFSKTMQLLDRGLDAKRQELAKRYAGLMRWLSAVEVAVVVALLLALVFSGISVKLSYLLAFPQPWSSALYFFVLVLGFGILMIPFTYYQGFALPRRYGMSNQKFGAWLSDRAKASAITILLGVAAVIIIYWLLERFPGTWWLLAGLLLAFLSVLLTCLAPILLLPLFFKLEPLNDLELKRKLIDLAERANARFNSVFTVNWSSKGTTANAMVAGLGKTRRIILSDTLCQQYTPDEVEVILAHELGHHIHRDMIKMIAVQAGMVLLAFYLAHLVLRASLVRFGFQGITDVAALPVMLLSLAVFSLVVMPLTNTYSRHLEKSADKAALELTGNPQAFVTAMTKLTNQNLAVAEPGSWVEFLFCDHPSYSKRVKLARRYL